MVNIVDILRSLEDKDIEESFSFLDSLNLRDSDLKLIIDAKYSGNRLAQNKAYAHWGSRLVDHSYRETIQEIIKSSPNIRIPSVAVLG